MRAPAGRSPLRPERLDEWDRRLAAGESREGLSALALSLLEAGEASLPSAAADSGAPPAEIERLWHRFLDVTRRPAFLQALGGRGQRQRWAEAAFAAIRVSRYTLAQLLAQRVREHPGRTLLRRVAGARGARLELRGGRAPRWRRPPPSCCARSGAGRAC